MEKIQILNGKKAYILKYKLHKYEIFQKFMYVGIWKYIFGIFIFNLAYLEYDSNEFYLNFYGHFLDVNA